MTERLPIAWRPRDVPLDASAAVARGEASRLLARRLLRDPERLASCRLLAGASLLLVIASWDALPWVDGVLYLGRDESAPALLVPTQLAPDVPLPLIERALLRRAGETEAPLAVLPGPRLLIAAGRARTASPADLAAWLEEPTA